MNQTERQTTKRFIFGNSDNKCPLIKFNYKNALMKFIY